MKKYIDNKIYRNEFYFDKFLSNVEYLNYIGNREMLLSELNLKYIVCRDFFSWLRKLLLKIFIRILKI